MATRGLSGNRNEQGDFITSVQDALQDDKVSDKDMFNMITIRDSILEGTREAGSDDSKAKISQFTDAFRKKNPDDTRSVIYKMLELNPNIINHLSDEQIKTGTFPAQGTREFQNDMFGAYNAALELLLRKLRNSDKQTQKVE